MAKSRSSSARSTLNKNTMTVFQFKITLRDVRPPIWRRIQVLDGTLDRLHEHIQTAMGWSNSHLHQFLIDGVNYGDSELLDDGFAHVGELEDSRQTRLGRLLARRNKGFRFLYEYDFGDCWTHDVVFEDRCAFDARKRYPICVEGRRACPPEDVGGAPGYLHLLEVLSNRNHPEYREMRQWAGVNDPDSFSPQQASIRMHEGLPDWRSD